jgi:hypothetical protein
MHSTHYALCLKIKFQALQCKLYSKFGIRYQYFFEFGFTFLAKRNNFNA